MSNGEVCCLLQVCCPPDLREDIAVKHIKQDMGVPEEHARAAFCWIAERFDLAPKGTVQPLIDAIATMARAHKAHE